MKKHAVVVALVVVALAMLVFPLLALAQGAVPVPAPNNVNPAGLVAWCATGAVFIGALVSVFRPDNTALPITVSTRTRVYIAAGLGAVEAFMLAVVGGTPWVQAIGTALVSAITGFAAHGARVPPGVTQTEAVAAKSHRPPPNA